MGVFFFVAMTYDGLLFPEGRYAKASFRSVCAVEHNGTRFVLFAVVRSYAEGNGSSRGELRPRLPIDKEIMASIHLFIYSFIHSFVHSIVLLQLMAKG